MYCILDGCNSTTTLDIKDNIKVSSFKSGENIQKEGGPDCTVSNNKLSSVTLTELAIKTRESILLYRVSTQSI